MLYDSKDMPKIQTVTDPKTIEKYGGTYSVILQQGLLKYIIRIKVTHMPAPIFFR